MRVGNAEPRSLLVVREHQPEEVEAAAAEGSQESLVTGIVLHAGTCSLPETVRAACVKHPSPLTLAGIDEGRAETEIEVEGNIDPDREVGGFA
mmetsp:Transcript_6907/g.9884  ORF Transcript_6907/g.9884 Transcript_6907/m.9884 type:complete len:93 (+) Transcript_6907:612-890(+)